MQTNNMTKPHTIATVCARGGSKGLPRKNVLDFAGKPLIAHSIEHARACPQIDGVYVSTDDNEIADIARQYGAIVPYRRPAELASDNAGKLSVIEHLLRYLESDGMVIDRIVDLQPTSPLRIPQDISQALELSLLPCDLVVTVERASHHPSYTLVYAGNDGLVHLVSPMSVNVERRQNLSEVLGLNGSIYIWQRAALTKACKDGFWCNRIRAYVMPRERSVDIDDLFDFELALWLFQRQKVKV
ncbi:MAG: acylneuraminate cytidylyltransferase family protein [Planctomycetota bacterium]